MNVVTPRILVKAQRVGKALSEARLTEARAELSDAARP